MRREAFGMPPDPNAVFALEHGPREPRRFPAYSAFRTPDGSSQIVSEDRDDPQWATWPKDPDMPIAFSENASDAFKALAHDLRSRGN